MWKETELAYLAGIIDGEGSFYIGCTRSKFNSRLYVVNTDIKVIQWLKNTFGGLTYKRNSLKNPQWKTRYEWIIEKAKIDSFCKKIIPYLIIKKEHANIMIKFRSTFQEIRRPVPIETMSLRFELMNELKKLNHRSSI